ncbi:MAG: PilN domain-containing protein [Deltaproteobacteria bacterium]|nr:PilN domain-containing protein [Deltaproteobacteria bacterium]
MPGKILGLDIGYETITAVHVTGSTPSYDVDDIRIIDIEKAGGIDSALKELLDGNTAPGSVCITSLAARYCSFRTVLLPFTGKKKILQTIPYELEPLLPFAVDDVVIDYLVIDQTDQSNLFTAAVPTAHITDLVGMLRENHHEALIIDIDAVPVALKLMSAVMPGEYGLLLDRGSRDTTAVIFTNEKILHVRHYFQGSDTLLDETGSGTEARAAESDAVRSEAYRKFLRDVGNTLNLLGLRGDLDGNLGTVYLTGSGADDSLLKQETAAFFSVPAEPVDLSTIGTVRFTGETEQQWNPLTMNRALALATRGIKKAAGFNYAVGAFEPQRKYDILKKNVKSVAAVLITVAVLFGIDLFMDYRCDRIYVQQMKSAIRTIFTETMPGVTRVVDPLQQMRTALNEMRKTASGMSHIGSGPTVLDILNAISQQIPPWTDLLITSFTINGPIVEIKGETDNFNTVDAIKNALDKSTLFANVKISSANLMKKGSRVGFDVRMDVTTGAPPVHTVSSTAP